MKKIMFNDKYGLTQAVLEGMKKNDENKNVIYPKKSHPNKNFKDLTGLKFGRLTVLSKNNIDKYRSIYWKCKCDCGNIVVVRGNSLKSGNTKSCGCLVFETKPLKHGLRNTRLYRIWTGIKSRCYNTNLPVFNRYGGRGIKMCDEWKKDFMSFYNWSNENGYSDDLSIDRIDNNGDYSPSNCRWATDKEQSDNKRNNILININGEVKDLQQWCDFYGIKRSTVNTRVRACGWDYKTALTKKVRSHKEYDKRNK